MAILIFILTHWYLSLFFQTFFHHRYAGHRHFSMTKCWEKVFYIAAWAVQGFTALSPNAYGKMHLMHHAYTDTEKDVHSPHHDKSPLAMLLRTHKLFRAIRFKKMKVEERFNSSFPWWPFMEKYAYTAPVRVFWGLVYVCLYAWMVPENSLWMWFLLPVHFLMAPLQGVVINWFAHLIGYTNYNVSNKSKNLIPIDILMLGEAYHNNHHARPDKVSFSTKWYEFDPVYPVILLFNWIGVIKINND